MTVAFYPEERAKVVAQELTKLDYDGWTYEAVKALGLAGERGNWAVKAYDEDDLFVDYLGLHLVGVEQEAVAKL